jgi:hypothetical protein
MMRQRLDALWSEFQSFFCTGRDNLADNFIKMTPSCQISLAGRLPADKILDMQAMKGADAAFGRRNSFQNQESQDMARSEGLSDLRPGTASQFSLLSHIQSGHRTIQQKKMFNSLFPSTLQAKMGDEEELLQKKTLQRAKSSDDDDLIRQRKVDSSSVSSPAMPTYVQNKMENTFNADFSNVRIHPNSSKASSVGALAYTQGQDIHFAQGKFDPVSKSGQELLGHELTHVVQQSAGKVSPTMELAGMAINDDPGLEREADLMGRKAAQ